MNLKPKVGIIGTGNIGSELHRKLKLKGWNVLWVISTDGIFDGLPKTRKIDDSKNYQKHLKGLDLVFLAIPTLDDGYIAYNYIKNCLAKNIPIVTCEKGALSNYFTELESSLSLGKIGYSSTVGGGSRLLRYLKERVGAQVEEMHAVVNGTLNYIFSGLSEGRSLGEVVEETKKLGYAEPGAKHPLDVINSEAIDDVRMKSAILFNVCNLTTQKIRAKDIKPNKIKNSELKKLNREAQNRRYIVSIEKNDDKEEDVIWGFKHRVNNWCISAGFKHIDDNPLFRKLIPEGVDNAILISEGEFGRDGAYVLSGPGAGSGPTTNSMIIDAEAILSKRSL